MTRQTSKRTEPEQPAATEEELTQEEATPDEQAPTVGMRPQHIQSHQQD